MKDYINNCLQNQFESREDSFVAHVHRKDSFAMQSNSMV